MKAYYTNGVNNSQTLTTAGSFIGNSGYVSFDSIDTNNRCISVFDTNNTKIRLVSKSFERIGNGAASIPQNNFPTLTASMSDITKATTYKEGSYANGYSGIMAVDLTDKSKAYKVGTGRARGNWVQYRQVNLSYTSWTSEWPTSAGLGGYVPIKVNKATGMLALSMYGPSGNCFKSNSGITVNIDATDFLESGFAITDIQDATTSTGGYSNATNGGFLCIGGNQPALAGGFSISNNQKSGNTIAFRMWNRNTGTYWGAPTGHEANYNNNTSSTSRVILNAMFRLPKYEYSSYTSGTLSRVFSDV